MSKIYGRPVATPLNPKKFKGTVEVDATLSTEGKAADAKVTGQALAGKAGAGFGYGEVMDYIVDESGTFEDKLTAIFNSLADHQCKQFDFYDTKGLIGNKFTGKLWRYTAQYGVLEAVTYHNYKALKRFYGGVWQPWEWENPPMTTNVEYRTIERINGKAVYKIADDSGNVMYRLDGDDVWSSYADLVGGNAIEDLTGHIATAGGIASGEGSLGAGAESDSSGSVSSYLRSDYIPVRKGDIVKYSNMECASNYAIIAVYDNSKAVLTVIKGQSKAVSGALTITEDGYIRLCNKTSVLAAVAVELRTKKEGNFALRKTLNILVIGNSFSQDSFAYLPPVLNEILHDYSITYGVAYADSTELPEQVIYKINKSAEEGKEPNPYYDWFNYWEAGATKWERESRRTIEEVVARKKWDIIYLQPGGSSSSDSIIRQNIINPGRTILNWLQERNGGPFSLMVGNHLAVSDTSFVNLCNGMVRAKQWLGIRDFIPIGTAIQNARTNAEWAKLEGQGIGTAGATTAPVKDKDGNITGYKTPHPLLYKDCTHMQAGIPALIATYTIALKILECVGESHRGIYDSSFVPTTENCVAIGAGSESGGTEMTHGDSMGVTAENIKLAQEYAVLAVNNPTTVSNGSNLPADMPGGTVTDAHINSLIDAKLGVIENGTY